MTAERQAFPARTDALPEVMAYVEGRCAELGVARPATLRLMLVAEELFINAVTHGYGGDSAKTVELAVRDTGAEVELVAEDTAAQFDPFASPPAVADSADPADRPLGGLGRVLITGLSSRQAYERRGRRNRVTVGVLKVRTTPAP